MKPAPKKGKFTEQITAGRIDWNIIRSPLFLVLFIGMMAGTFIAYSGHFNNPFHFDDDHTVVTNKWIRELDSFPKFFTDATTTSSLPRNQAYRPGVTLLHAIDYHFSIDTTSSAAKARLDSAVSPAARKEIMKSMLQPKTFVFHVHIFIGFILSGLLLFFVLLHIFKQAMPGNKLNEWLALFGTGWFWLHTANAETINYISARSDSASTFWILLTFVIYFYSSLAKRFHLYLIPMVIGFFIKEPAIMFAPLLLAFISLFETSQQRPLIKYWFPIATAFLSALILFKISRSYTPTTWSAGGTDPFHYLITEAFVIVHYFINFILPVNLSADTDWIPVIRIWDDKVIVGTAFILLLLFITVKCWRFREWRPVSFGIIWFLIALAPTSSIFPFAEVLNDHRTYFPYIGLIISVTWTIGMWLNKLQERNTQYVKYAGGIAVLILLIHGIGARERSTLWSSSNLLWGDCVKKSPQNGRAWMHYGMSLFEKGNDARLRGHADSVNYWYDSANVCYSTANKYTPYYSYLFINWGVLRQWQGRMAEAETFYRNALSYDDENPESYYFLGDFLRMQNKNEEAYSLALKGLQLSPEHERLKGLFNSVANVNPYAQIRFYLDRNKEKPEVNNYINLSLQYYFAHEYENCIKAAKEALKMDSTNYLAWNNICSADNVLGDYNDAIFAGNKSLNYKHDFGQAAANILETRRCMNIQDSLEKKLPAKPTADDYINLSLSFYNAKMYARAIMAAETALTIRPNDPRAYNNICTSCNRLSWFDRAVEAGNKAVQFAPTMELAINNLKEANAGKVSVDNLKKTAGL